MHFIFSILFLKALVDIRRRVTLKQLAQILISVSFIDLANKQIELATELLKKRIKENRPLKAMVLGHAHRAFRHTTPLGSIFNTGTWTRRYRLPDKPEGVRGKLRWWFGKIPMVEYSLYTFFMAEFDENNEMHADLYIYDPETDSYKEMI